jgi:Arc/MetJ-type ribon-helix-helix transcriptional regulator
MKNALQACGDFVSKSDLRRECMRLKRQKWTMKFNRDMENQRMINKLTTWILD